MNLSQQNPVSPTNFSPRPAVVLQRDAVRMPRPLGVAHIALLLIGAAFLAFGLTACGGSNAADGKAGAHANAAPPVHVATAVQRTVTDWDTFTGRFEAIDSVKLRPRVSGYIDSVSFAEGKDVKKGDVLFVIDPRPYRVQLQRTQGELARAKAQADLSEKELQRSESLLAAHAVSQEEYEQRLSQRNQLAADLQAAKAAADAAQLDMEFTRVVAPIDGRVSRAEVTAGNFVSAGTTVLTSVVSLDPIYVYFEGDEQTYLKYNAQAQRGERPSSRENPNPVFVGLANEADFPHAGVMNFVDNALNPETGTIRARAVLDNREHLFTPGMLARVKLLGSGQYNATLIPDEAIGTDQDRKFVMVINAQNIAEYRAVQLGEVFENQRIVRGGVQAGERVIVGGLQRVRPGMPVTPEAVNPPQDKAVAQALPVAASANSTAPAKVKY
jgi:RND family efflux transporter MFP subunit